MIPLTVLIKMLGNYIIPESHYANFKHHDFFVNFFIFYNMCNFHLIFKVTIPRTEFRTHQLSDTERRVFVLTIHQVILFLSGPKDNLNETVTIENEAENIVRTTEVGNEKKRPRPLELTNTIKQVEDLNNSGIQFFL